MGSQLPRLWPPSGARRPRRRPEQPLPAASRRRVRAAGAGERRRHAGSAAEASASAAIARFFLGRTTFERAERSHFCFAMTEQSSEELAPVDLILVRSRRLVDVGGDDCMQAIAQAS
jgi:hypothetical protein